MFTRKNRNSIPDMSQLFGHYPKPASEGSFPNRDTFLNKSLKKISFERSPIPQQGCSRLLSSEGVISAPKLGQIVHRRIMHLPHSHSKGRHSPNSQNYCSSPSSNQRSFNRTSWFSKNFPNPGYSSETEDHQQPRCLHFQMASRDLFSQSQCLHFLTTKLGFIFPIRSLTRSKLHKPCITFTLIFTFTIMHHTHIHTQHNLHISPLARGSHIIHAS